MARIEVSINGRAYPIRCEDGQEDRVRDMAAFVDDYLQQIRRTAQQQTTETHLMVMLCLMLADELHDQQEALKTANRQPMPRTVDDNLVADAIAQVASRIEALAQQFETH